MQPLPDKEAAAPMRTIGRFFTRRVLLVVYWGSAAFLAPWIVALYKEQSANGVAYHLHLVRFGVSLLMVLGMLATAAGCWRNSHFTVVFGTLTATLTIISAWFATVTTTGRSFDLALGYALIVQLPVALLCTWIVRRLFRPLGGHTSPPAMVAPVLAFGAIALLPLVVVLSHGLPSQHAAHHLRLVWTGLDIFELIGLAATGWCLYRRLPSVAVAAAFTGTLLFCDAWFNVVATTGAVQLAGIAMALVELPLAALSFVVARREVRGWPEASPRRSAAILGR